MKIILSILIIVSAMWASEKNTNKIIKLLNKTKHNNPSIIKQIAKKWSNSEVRTKYYDRTDIKKNGEYKSYIPSKLKNNDGKLIGSKGKLWIYPNVNKACKIWKNIVETNGVKLKKYHKNICKGAKKGYGAITLETGITNSLKNGFWSFSEFEVISNKKIKYTHFQGQRTLYIMREKTNDEKDDKQFKKAVYNNDIYTLKKILEKNSKINLDKYFFIATEVSTLKTLRFLVNNGANINYRDRSSNALNKTSHNNENISKLKYLMSLGLKPNKKNHPIFSASRGRQINIIKFWIDKGTDINIQDHEKRTPIFAVARNIKNIFAGITYYDTKKLLKYMIKKGANPKHKSKYNETILHLISKYGTLKEVKYVVDLFDNINIKGKMGKTPLHYAVENINPDNKSMKYDVIKFLLDNGANQDIKDTFGKTALENLKK